MGPFPQNDHIVSASVIAVLRKMTSQEQRYLGVKDKGKEVRLYCYRVDFASASGVQGQIQGIPYTSARTKVEEFADTLPGLPVHEFVEAFREMYKVYGPPITMEILDG